MKDVTQLDVNYCTPVTKIIAKMKKFPAIARRFLATTNKEIFDAPWTSLLPVLAKTALTKSSKKATDSDESDSDSSIEYDSNDFTSEDQSEDEAEYDGAEEEASEDENTDDSDSE